MTVAGGIAAALRRYRPFVVLVAAVMVIALVPSRRAANERAFALAERAEAQESIAFHLCVVAS